MDIRPYKRAVALGFVTVLLGIAIYLGVARQAGAKPILLEGTIVMPDKVIQDGWILIQQGRISLVSDSKPDAPDAIQVDTAGIIFPGLIDLHNHISYDVFPHWTPSHVFSDRYEWRSDPDFIRLVDDPYTDLSDTQKLFCDMNTYGELRALAGGTTSILATALAPCTGGLVRNLDTNSGFYRFPDSDSHHILNKIEIRSSTDPATIKAAKSFLADDRAEAFLVHSAEGVDASSLAEFYFLQAQGLLTAKTAIIHGVALGPAEYQAMRDAGASLVWSPASNIDLYGQTADIPAALDAGLQIALAPDWSISGSSNMLDELHFAAQWNSDHFSDRLTAEQLVGMVTSIPAEIAGIDDETGAIQQGLFADLLVISGDTTDPYQALIEAQAADVQLVIISGQPIYGEPDLMAIFWNPSELNALKVDGVAKSVKLPKSSMSIDDLESKLSAALTSAGTDLAPIH